MHEAVGEAGGKRALRGWGERKYHHQLDLCYKIVLAFNISLGFFLCV